MHHQKLVRAWARALPAGLLLLLLLLVALLAPGALAAGPEAPDQTFPVSVSAGGAWADGGGVVEYTTPSISADGRYVAFQSASQNLGEAGPAGVVEGFVKDLATGAVSLVTRADGPGGEAAGEPGISNLRLSGDGRFVVFSSAATNLGTSLPGATAGEPHVYRRDLGTGATAMVDPADGAEAEAVAADGRYVAFIAGGVGFVRDMEAETTVAVSRASGAAGAIGDEPAEWLSLAPDGRSVAFASRATNLVPGVEEGVWDQVYRRDLETETTSLVSQNALGGPGDRSSVLPEVSGADGCHIVFSSIAFNLLQPSPLEVSGEQVYLADVCASPPVMTLVSQTATEPIAPFAYSVAAAGADGSKVIFAGELGGASCCHLYLRDLAAGQTSQLDRASGASGALADAEVQEFALSENGCRAVFASRATNLYGEGPPRGEEPTELYARQLAPCAEQPPATDPGGSPRGGDPGPSITPVARMKVRRVGSRGLVLDLSAAGRVTVRVRRLLTSSPREWKLVRTIDRGLEAPGPLEIPLTDLPPGRYRLNLHLHGTPAGTVRYHILR
jgi:Tol biopolymer transport system component